MKQLQNTDITKNVVAQAMDWAYSKAVTGFTGIDSAYELANNYLQKDGTLDEQVETLIRWQTAKSTASGFVTGLGGLLTMPITVPANIASVIYVQIRMICAIAYMGGYDIRDDRVKTFIYLSMVGNGAKDLLKNVSIKLGEKAIIKALSSINTKITAKLAIKIGEKSAASAGKAIPILGGIVSGSLDAFSTRIIGKMAKKIFIEKKDETKKIIEILPKDVEYIDIKG